MYSFRTINLVVLLAAGLLLADACTKEKLPALPGETEAVAQAAAACGSPSNVVASWSYCPEGYCRLRLITTAVPLAKKYNWSMHWVYQGVVDPTPYVTTTTTGTSWNYGCLGDPDCFVIRVTAVCPSGAGKTYVSKVKCPPAGCLYPLGPVEQSDF